MTKIVRLIMILLTIVLFSCSLVSFMVMFVLPNPQSHAIFSVASFIISCAINQEIIDDEKISEYDETF